MDSIICRSVLQRTLTKVAAFVILLFLVVMGLGVMPALATQAYANDDDEQSATLHAYENDDPEALQGYAYAVLVKS